jgi:hypothetical protein
MRGRATGLRRRRLGKRLMNDDAFLAGFENCTLSGAAFHHADHVRMAFLYLSRYSVLEAMQRFSAALARFAAANGKPERYNETITWALLLLIRERMARAESRPSWLEFAQENADLLDWKDNILKKYYRDETLNSELAKRMFLFPDRAVRSL